MKLVEVGTDDVSGGTLVVVEHPNGKRHTWVQEPESLWRDVVTGEFITRLDETQLEPLLWLHRREEARKSREAAGRSWRDSGRRWRTPMARTSGWFAFP